MATFLAIMLTMMLGGSFVAFLVFITFGLFLWVILISGVIAVFIGVNYLIWGRPKPDDEDSSIKKEDQHAGDGI